MFSIADLLAMQTLDVQSVADAQPAQPVADDQPVQTAPPPAAPAAADAQPALPPATVDVVCTGKAHPVADCFPLMEGDALYELANSIRQHGLRVPILITPEGEILDGRNRWVCCKQVHVEPRYEVVDVQPAEYMDVVLAHNVHRRHLTASQRAMVAARLGTGNVSGLTQEARSAALSVSDRTLRDAERVLESGDADLIAAVDKDDLKVHAAYLSLPKKPKKPKKSALDRELDRANKETKRGRADDNKRRVAAAGSATAGPATAVIPDSDLEDLLPDVQCTHCPVHCPDPDVE